MTPTIFTSLTSTGKQELLDVALNLSFRILINNRILEVKEQTLNISESLPEEKFRFKYFQLQKEIRLLEDLLQFLTNIREEFIQEQ